MIYLQCFFKLAKNGPIELREEIIKALTQTRQKMEQVTTNWEHIESVLSHTFIHGDYHPNNVLFKGNKAAYICDFDFVMPAERIYDIITAFVCYRWIYEANPEDIEESEPDMFFFEPYLNFLSDYNEQTMQRLTLEELKALVPDMQRLLLLYGSKAAMHGDDLEGMLRWLTARLKRVEWLEHYQVEFERAFQYKYYTLVMRYLMNT